MKTDQIATFTRRTHELYRRLMEGTLPVEATLAGLQKLVEGNLGSKTVDLDADPFVPEVWSVEEHKKGGMLDIDAAKIALHLSDKQKGNGLIEGNQLREELKTQPVLNANLLDWLLRKENQHLIPEEWKGKAIFFWGTIYRNRIGELWVRCLDWRVGGWYWSGYWLDNVWHSNLPAAVLAS